MKDETYSISDFVYYRTEDKQKVQIGQIVFLWEKETLDYENESWVTLQVILSSFLLISIQFRLIFQEMVKDSKDSQKLIANGEKENVRVDRIDGKCDVKSKLAVSDWDSFREQKDLLYWEDPIEE